MHDPAQAGFKISLIAMAQPAMSLIRRFRIIAVLRGKGSRSFEALAMEASRLAN